MYAKHGARTPAPQSCTKNAMMCDWLQGTCQEDMIGEGHRRAATCQHGCLPCDLPLVPQLLHHCPHHGNQHHSCGKTGSHQQLHKYGLGCPGHNIIPQPALAVVLPLKDAVQDHVVYAAAVVAACPAPGLDTECMKVIHDVGSFTQLLPKLRLPSQMPQMEAI